MALAGHYGRPITEASFPAGPSDPGSVATAARFALEAGADWLVLPLAGPDEDHGVPLALRLVELEGAISRWGLPSLVAPLLRRDWRELGRLAVAFDVPVALSTDCDRADGCVRCRGRARALAAAGLPR